MGRPIWASNWNRILRFVLRRCGGSLGNWGWMGARRRQASSEKSTTETRQSACGRGIPMQNDGLFLAIIHFGHAIARIANQQIYGVQCHTVPILQNDLY